MASKKFRYHGLTLIELLISLAIAMVALFALIGIYSAVKGKYNTYKNKTSVEVKGLITKSIIDDFLKDTGFACKFGYTSQTYYDMTGDSLDSFFTNSSPIIVGPLPFSSGSTLSSSMEEGCSGECYQTGTDYIMIKKEENHTKLTKTNYLSSSLNLNSLNDLDADDYLAVCNDKYINLVKVTATDNANSVSLALALNQGAYYPGDYAGKYNLQILYIRNTGQKDEKSNDIYALYVYIKDSSSRGSSYELIRDVKNLQVEYSVINNNNVVWSPISNNTNINNSDYSALKVSFTVGDEPFSKIVLL